MADSDRRPTAQGDEAELFRAYYDELMRTFSRAVLTTNAQTVEDACAFAWARFLECQPDRDRNWQGWLFRTAQHKAWAIEREVRDDFTLWTEAEFGVEDAVATVDEFQIR